MSDATAGRGFGYWLTIFANVAVVGGIVFLGVEVRQNSQMMRAETRHEVARGGVDLNTLTATDSALASIVLKGRAGEQLSGVERERYVSWMNSWLRYWEDVHYQYRNGLYDQIEFAQQLEAIRSAFAGGGWASHWCARRAFYSPLFAAEIDGLLGTRRC